MHELLKAIQAEGLTRFYLGYEPVVHGGMPHVAPVAAVSTQWLRPSTPGPGGRCDHFSRPGSRSTSQRSMWGGYFIPPMPEILVRAIELPGSTNGFARAEAPHLAFSL